MGERVNGIHEVRGSIPLASIAPGRHPFANPLDRSVLERSILESVMGVARAAGGR